MRGKLLVALGLVLAVVAIAGLASLRAQESPEAPQVITIGSGGFLGVYLEEVDDAATDRLGLREERGALIAEVSEDGPAAEATFNNPQGMALDGETLYVCDTDNHAIRAINLAGGTVTTLGGGRILSASGIRLRRNRPWTLAALAARRDALDSLVTSPERRVTSHVGVSPTY